MNSSGAAQAPRCSVIVLLGSEKWEEKPRDWLRGRGSQIFCRIPTCSTIQIEKEPRLEGQTLHCRHGHDFMLEHSCRKSNSGLAPATHWGSYMLSASRLPSAKLSLSLSLSLSYAAWLRPGLQFAAAPLQPRLSCLISP